MKVSVEWLKKYVPCALSPEEIAKLLTNVGLEVEAVERLGPDTLLMTEVTTNRPDWLCHLGVAREVAAAIGAKLEVPAVKLAESKPAAAGKVSVEIIDTDLCPRYTARVITGVRVGPSPAWLVKCIDAMGLRPVNNVVDITNFVLFECGQPLHAFDYDKLAGPRIIVRRGKKGECLTAIDGSRHELTADELAICDASRPVAIAGVMGGLDTEVGSATKNVLLESARFNAFNIRRTSQKLALESDSSYRFARGIDPETTEWASRRAAALMADVCGGTVLEGIVDADAAPFARREVTLRAARVGRILGIQVPEAEIVRILGALGCETLRSEKGVLTLRIPGFRGDLEREIDLIEEVARCHGLDKIPSSPSVSLRIAAKDDVQSKTALAAEVLMAAGFDECVTISFIDPETPKAVNPWTDATPLRVENPVDVERPCLRTSLLPSLLAARQLNQSRRNEDVRLFEVAHVYVPRGGEELPNERLMLGLVGDVDFRAMKGAVETLLARFGVADVTMEEGSLGFLGAQLAIRMKGEVIGYIGEPTDELLARCDLKKKVTAAEIDFGRVMASAQLRRKFAELPRFPSIERDLALVLDETVRWADVEAVIERRRPAILESVGFMSEFRGKQIPAGKKSLAFSMTFRSPDRTLTHEEADAAQAAILAALTKELGVVLRQ